METLRYVLVVNGLLTVVSVAYYVLLRRETFFSTNRLALWLGLLGALVLPLLKLPDWRPQPVRTAMQRTAQVIVPRVLPDLHDSEPEVTITFPNHKTYTAFQIQPRPFVWSWQIGLIALYLAGIFVLAIRFVIQLISLKKLINRSVHEPYNEFTLAWNEGISSPFSFFDWVIVNPNQHTPDELEQILRHERVHVRERHSLDMIGTEVLCIIFWFNPAAYLFRYLLQQTLEFRADQVVLTEGVDAKAYQYNLLKVSLSASKTLVTNHFSKSQLKPRIAMINRPHSSTFAWIKYPVFYAAALMVATVFARPQHIQLLRGFVPVSIVQNSGLTSKPNSASIQPVAEKAQAFKKATIAETQISPTKALSELAGTKLDTVKSPQPTPSDRVSPSRYMFYRGDYLYWIVTPKTTFDDFAVMKQEFAKQGHQMQLNEIKYDPLYAYIDRISFTVQRPSGGMTRCDELDEDNKPMPSIAGYVGVGSKAGESGTGGLRYYKNDFPEPLLKTAAEEEAEITQFIKEHRLEYLIQEGEQKFKDLGSGSSTYHSAFFKNKSTRTSGLLVQPDGSLAIDEQLGDVKVFVNNEPVTREAVSSWKVDQVYSVVRKSQYNPARKESFTSALLIYTTE